MAVANVCYHMSIPEANEKNMVALATIATTNFEPWAGRHFSFLKKAGRHQGAVPCKNGLGRTLTYTSVLVSLNNTFNHNNYSV